VRELSEKAAKDPKSAAAKELRALAARSLPEEERAKFLAADTATEQEIKTARQDKIKKDYAGKEADLRKFYKERMGKEADASMSFDAMAEDMAKYASKFADLEGYTDSAVLAASGSDKVSESDVERRAMEAVGQTAGGTKEEQRKNKRIRESVTRTLKKVEEYRQHGGGQTTQ
jgi:hypothetical protein